MATKAEQIQKLIDQNEIDDLKASFQKRDCLNTSNVYLNYVSKALVYSGIIVLLIGKGDNKICTWIGTALVIASQLLVEYQGNHEKMLKTLLLDITNIKKGSFVDSENILNGIEQNPGYVKVYTQDALQDTEDPIPTGYMKVNQSAPFQKIDELKR